MTTISGRVVDARGKGVAAARVMVTAGPGPIPDMAMLTDADGGFVIGASRSGSYTIAATTGTARGEHVSASRPIRSRASCFGWIADIVAKAPSAMRVGRQRGWCHDPLALVW